MLHFTTWRAAIPEQSSSTPKATFTPQAILVTTLALASIALAGLGIFGGGVPLTSNAVVADGDEFTTMSGYLATLGGNYLRLDFTDNGMPTPTLTLSKFYLPIILKNWPATVATQTPTSALMPTVTATPEWGSAVGWLRKADGPIGFCHATHYLVDDNGRLVRYLLDSTGLLNFYVGWQVWVIGPWYDTVECGWGIVVYHVYPIAPPSARMLSTPAVISTLQTTNTPTPTATPTGEALGTTLDKPTHFAVSYCWHRGEAPAGTWSVETRFLRENGFLLDDLPALQMHFRR